MNTQENSWNFSSLGLIWNPARGAIQGRPLTPTGVQRSSSRLISIGWYFVHQRYGYDEASLTARVRWCRVNDRCVRCGNEVIDYAGRRLTGCHVATDCRERQV